MTKKKIDTHKPVKQKPVNKPQAKRFGDPKFQWLHPGNEAKRATERALEDATRGICEMLEQTDGEMRNFLLIVYLLLDTEDISARWDAVFIIENIVLGYESFREQLKEFTYGKQEQ